MATEWGVQIRTYVDQGWEASSIQTRTGIFGDRLFTEAEAFADAARRYRHPDDSTGLPPARVVRREVGAWGPA